MPEAVPQELNDRLTKEGSPFTRVVVLEDAKEMKENLVGHVSHETAAFIAELVAINYPV